MKIAKSPMSATIAFHYEVTCAGIEQIGDETFDASDGGRNMIQWLVPHPFYVLRFSDFYKSIRFASYLTTFTQFLHRELEGANVRVMFTSLNFDTHLICVSSRGYLTC